MSQIGSEKYLKPSPKSSEHINFSKLQIPCFPISACHWKESVTPPYDQRRNGFHALLLLKHYHRAPCCVHGTSWMRKTHGSLNVGSSHRQWQALLILQKSHNKRYKTYPKKYFENPHSIATHLGKGKLESCQHVGVALNYITATTSSV